MHYYYIATFLKVILGGPVQPSYDACKKILVKSVQSLYLGLVSEHRLFNPFGFL